MKHCSRYSKMIPLICFLCASVNKIWIHKICKSLHPACVLPKCKCSTFVGMELLAGTRKLVSGFVFWGVCLGFCFIWQVIFSCNHRATKPTTVSATQWIGYSCSHTVFEAIYTVYMRSRLGGDELERGSMVMMKWQRSLLSTHKVRVILIKNGRGA